MKEMMRIYLVITICKFHILMKFPDDPIEDKIIEKVQIKYGPKDWEEFDQLQQQQRQMDFYSDQSEDHDRKKRKRKPTKKQKKHKIVKQYEAALKRHRSMGGAQFHNPFQPQKLNLQFMPVLKMLQRAFEHEYNLEQTLRKMGLKTSKILFKCGARTNLGFILMYLKQGSIHKWIIERHRQMMKKKEHQLICDQNTLLRTMSNNNSNCL